MIEYVFRTIMKIYTPMKQWQEQIIHWIYAWIPCFLYEISYCPDDSTQVVPIYSAKRYIPWGKHRFGKLQGHLYIKYWNHDMERPEEMILHSSLLVKAIHMDTLEYVWAFSEEGFLTLLLSYIQEHQQIRMIDATLGSRNLYKENPSLLSSLGVPENKITPARVGLFLQKNLDVNDNIEFVYYDDGVKEIRIKSSEPIC